MNFTIEHEREEDGRWLAEVPELPGVLAYGAILHEAMAKAEVLALRVLASSPTPSSRKRGEGVFLVPPLELVMNLIPAG